MRPHAAPMSQMPTQPLTNADASTTIAPAAAERRTRHRFRELCDEVIASKRIAQGRDLWSPNDRDEARATLSRIAALG